MLFCRDFCGILVQNIGTNVEKWKLNRRFLKIYGTKCIKIIDEELIKYCKKGRLVIIKWLVENGVDITADNNLAVRWASHNGHLDVVQFLVSKGADVTADNNYAVLWASENEHLEVVEYLISKGARL